jgi:hypothetical protein
MGVGVRTSNISQSRGAFNPILGDQQNPLQPENFHQTTQIADCGYILVEGRIVFEGKSTAELSEPECVKTYDLSV